MQTKLLSSIAILLVASISFATTATVKISALSAIPSITSDTWLPVINTLNSGTTYRASAPMMSTYVSASMGAGAFIKSPYSGTITANSFVAAQAGTSNVFVVSDGGYVTAVAYLGDGSNLSGVIANPAASYVSLNLGVYAPTADITTLNCVYQTVMNAGQAYLGTPNMTGDDNTLIITKHNNATQASLIKFQKSDGTDQFDMGLTGTLQAPFIQLNYAGSPQFYIDGSGNNYSYIKGGLAVNTGNVQAGTAFTSNGAIGVSPASTPNNIVGNMFIDQTPSHNLHIYDGNAWRTVQWN